MQLIDFSHQELIDGRLALRKEVGCEGECDLEEVIDECEHLEYLFVENIGVEQHLLYLLLYALVH